MVDLKGISAEELALKLTMSTAEIDSIDYMNPFLKTVITARLLEADKHPDADKLTVVKADTGSAVLQVVCGASNHKKGDIAALAPVGTKFSDEFTVKEAKLRGVDSMGMLCSEKELGLSDDQSGIMIFPENTPLGKPISELYPEWCGVCLEIDNKSITHRPDLWSHAGFAREISALIGRPYKDPVDFSLTKDFQKDSPISVKIIDASMSPRYTGLIVKNIKIGESPEWLKAAVTAVGMRPINNIVDITNYVMAEIGEPMHAFDRKKLSGSEIIVRPAAQNEKLTTLDGGEKNLTSEDLVIADASGAVALAGVMGGGNSEIGEDTTEIVLEAASFNPVTIRKTAQRYSLRTEAAIRFEKSLSPELTLPAILRCYELIKMTCPGAIAASSLIDGYPEKQKPITVKTNTPFIRKRLGDNISDEKIISIIESLGFNVKSDAAELTIDVPYYRATKDISIPEDIVEEVGRILGYDNIAPIPPFVPSRPPARNPFRTFERAVKSSLSMEQRLIEVFGYSFTGPDILDKLGINEDKELRLLNPLSQEHDRLRRSLVPNIIRNIETNQRYNENFGIYELGRVYFKSDRKSPDLAKENTRVCGAYYAKTSESPVFYNAKSGVIALLKRLNITDYSIVLVSDKIPPYMHPFRSAELKIGKTSAGYIFDLHPSVKKKFDITGETALFDLDLNILFDAPKSERKFAELQRYPEVPFEISVVADMAVQAADIISVIKEEKSGLVKGAEVISIYSGGQIQTGKKSVSVKTVFSAPDRTLTPEEIGRIQKNIIDGLAAKGYPLR